MIKFVSNHRVGEGNDAESFEAGDEVKDRSPESEMHFVRRGVAVFVRGGKYFDHEDNPVDAATVETSIRTAKAEPEPAPARPARERRVAPRAMTGAATAAARGAGKRSAKAKNKGA